MFILRCVLKCEKFGSHIFSCQSLLLGTNVPNDKYIRNIKKSTSIPNTIHFGEANATDDVNKTILFNNFFLFFSTSNFISTNNNASVDSSVRQHLVSVNISEEEVFEALNSLDPDKSSGNDTIGPRVLKKCGHFLCGPLHHLFVTSLSKHTIPLDWCTHVITPVHKSGDKSLVNNYRPILLLSNTSKVLEQLIYSKIIHHISNFLTPKQFGFLKTDPQFNNCWYYLTLSWVVIIRLTWSILASIKLLTVSHIMNF